MKHKILLWDNNGTIMGAKNPDDDTCSAKVIMPGVKEAMQNAEFNFIISGFKSPESEAQNFDPEKVAARFTDLMAQLPIDAVAFSPMIGGVACYALIKKDNNIIAYKAHEDPRYKKYIGEFKKPGIGMFVVMKDIALEEFGQIINDSNSVMIGDTWHDEVAAKAFGIEFIDAQIIHR